jgi:AcrR family transcriptional regulator
MSRSTRLTRDNFITGMFAEVDKGNYGISLTDLCNRLDVTTGSFYSHFGDMPELHAAVTEIWARERIAALPDTSGDGVHDPLDILRKIQEAAGDAADRDSTMRRWAATAPAPGSAVPDRAPAWARSAPAVAAAVAAVDQIIAGHLTREVTHLGFTGREPADLANWLAAALHDPAVARDREAFETLLGVLVRAEAFTPQGPAVTTSTGSEPDAMRLYATARGLPDAERHVLGEVARLLAAGRNADDPQAGQDRAEAGQA